MNLISFYLTIMVSSLALGVPKKAPLKKMSSKKETALNVKTLDSIFLPAKNPQSKKLVIVLHGRGDSFEGFRWMPEILGLNDINYLMVNAPDRYFTGYSWYDLPPNQEAGILRSRKLLDKLIEEVLAAGYSLKETILFGFSQGSLMTLEWGGRTNHIFAAMIGVSGYVLDEKKLLEEASSAGKAVPRFISHGTMDGVLPFDQSQQQSIYLKKGGFNLDFHSYRKAHTIDEREEMGQLRNFIQKHLRAD